VDEDETAIASPQPYSSAAEPPADYTRRIWRARVVPPYRGRRMVGGECRWTRPV